MCVSFVFITREGGQTNQPTKRKPRSFLRALITCPLLCSNDPLSSLCPFISTRFLFHSTPNYPFNNHHRSNILGLFFFFLLVLIAIAIAFAIATILHVSLFITLTRLNHLLPIHN